jgi:PKD repeat protein
MKQIFLFLVLCCCKINLNAQGCDARFMATVQKATASFVSHINPLSRNHIWDFGDGTPNVYNSNSPIHTYNVPGTYKVKHIVLDSTSTTSCVDSTFQNITINEADSTCKTRFYTQRLASYAYNFTANTTSYSTSATAPIYSWNIDGTIINTAAGSSTLQHTFSSIGSHTVCLTSQSANGCTAIYCDTLNIIQVDSCTSETLSFTHQMINNNSKTIQFNAITNMQQPQLKWNFGDGNTAYYNFPNHTYAQAGTYKVTLTAIDSITWCTKYYEENITINNNLCDSFKIAFTHTQANNGVVNFNIIINDSSISQVWQIKPKILTSPIDSSKIITLIANNPTYQFTQGGSYVVCVTVTNTHNCITTYCDTLQVNLDSCASASASFNHTVISNNGKTIRFEASTNMQQPQLKWNFGDGNTAYYNFPNHTYAQAGTYKVTLTAYDSATWCTKQFEKYITIRDSIFNLCDSLKVSFSHTQLNNGVVTFTLNSNSPIVKQVWYINHPTDSSKTVIINTSNPTHTFTASGSYLVCVFVTSADSCTKFYCNTVQVQIANPINPCTNTNLALNYSPVGINSNTIKFTTVTNMQQPLFMYHFGDGVFYTTKQIEPVTHTYAKPGKYKVILTVIDSTTKCTKKIIKNITVGTMCDSMFVYFKYVAQHDGLVNFIAVSNKPNAKQVWQITNIADSSNSITINDKNPSYRFTKSGTYRVCLTLTTSNGCAVTYCENITVKQVESESYVSCYPNPVTSGNIRLTVTLAQNEVMQVKVMDVSSNIKMSFNVNGTRGANVITIPIDVLQKGQYFIEIKTNAVKKYSRFIKI